MYPSSSLLISTYNWPGALSLCLTSVLAQHVFPDEILIADDGSDTRTKWVIAEFQRKSPVPIRHIWHEDEGFRLAVIRNRAIAAAKGEYIIQIDGDMILNSSFIEDHLKFARQNTVVRASRMYINKIMSERILEEKNISLSVFSLGISNRLSAFRIPLLWPLFETNYKNRGAEHFEIHGCNMAFWRKDAIEVNGYNESFQGWGPEDKEFLAKLLNKGVKKRFLKLGAIAYHIYHTENSKAHLSINEQEFYDTINLKRTFSLKGINQYF